MAIELKIPEVGESITEVEVGEWLKGMGEEVKKDEAVVTLESEKATVELPAPESGTIAKVLKQKGDTAKVGEVIALLEQKPERGTSPARSTPESQTGQQTLSEAPESQLLRAEDVSRSV